VLSNAVAICFQYNSKDVGVSKVSAGRSVPLSSGDPFIIHKVKGFLDSSY